MSSSAGRMRARRNSQRRRNREQMRDSGEQEALEWEAVLAVADVVDDDCTMIPPVAQETSAESSSAKRRRSKSAAQERIAESLPVLIAAKTLEDLQLEITNAQLKLKQLREMTEEISVDLFAKCQEQVGQLPDTLKRKPGQSLTQEEKRSIVHMYKVACIEKSVSIVALKQRFGAR